MMPAELEETIRHSRLLLDESRIDQAIDRLATDLSARLADRDVLCLVVLNGGMVFAGQLLPRLRCVLSLDHVHLSRYGDSTTGKRLRWMHDVPEDVSGQTVLILDDIYDQGFTLEAIVERCRQRGAAEVVTAVLVHKRHRRARAALEPDFVGLECEDLYVYGCGMDYRGYGRNLPAIYAIDPTV